MYIVIFHSTHGKMDLPFTGRDLENWQHNSYQDEYIKVRPVTNPELIQKIQGQRYR
jgi:hypothetical protein